MVCRLGNLVVSRALDRNFDSSAQVGHKYWLSWAIWQLMNTLVEWDHPIVSDGGYFGYFPCVNSPHHRKNILGEFWENSGKILCRVYNFSAKGRKIDDPFQMTALMRYSYVRMPITLFTPFLRSQLPCHGLIEPTTHAYERSLVTQVVPRPPALKSLE